MTKFPKEIIVYIINEGSENQTFIVEPNLDEVAIIGEKVRCARYSLVHLLTVGTEIKVEKIKK